MNASLKQIKYIKFHTFIAAPSEIKKWKLDNKVSIVDIDRKLNHIDKYQASQIIDSFEKSDYQTVIRLIEAL